jgi:hypothetical protein
MMGGETGDQSQLFYLFNLEERIPADKPVEMRFAHLKIHHGFERMRLRGSFQCSFPTKTRTFSIASAQSGHAGVDDWFVFGR